MTANTVRRTSWAFAFLFLAGSLAGWSAPEPAPVPIPAEVLEQALGETLQDEWRSLALYQAIQARLGGGGPFHHISMAETRHADAIRGLYRSRGLEVPANRFADGVEIPELGTLKEACEFAARAETENAAIYDRYLVYELPDDVRAVFLHNRAASLEHHLPAFERCAERPASGAAEPGCGACPGGGCHHGGHARHGDPRP